MFISEDFLNIWHKPNNRLLCNQYKAMELYYEIDMQCIVKLKRKMSS